MNFKRKEVIGDCVLYLGDAMEILPDIEGVDLTVSDIPYALTTGGVSLSSKTMSGIFAAHNYANDGQLIMTTVPFPEMMKAIYEAMGPDGDCYVMANDKNVYPLMQAAFDAGFKLHNILVWDKVSPTPNRWYMKHLEFTIYLWKGKARTINHPESKQALRAGERNESKHPTEKPVSLMREYIRNSSNHGELVLDPFMGSGTTGVACANLGRPFIGIELDEGFFEMCCERIQRAYDRPDFFSNAPAEIIVQEQMKI
ncbi:MAG: hypothetical protein COB78_10045 [Hyphomicrobiales bacterium]|nr:MAG: hypothetical protein COB78_10045 [Hyphomicrobiales bacterium]